MGIHRTSGRWKLGLLLTLVTAFFWGSLPIAIREVVPTVDGITLTWFRFIGSAMIFSSFIYKRYGWPTVKGQAGSVKWLLVAATLGLCGNYVSYAFGLYYLTPSANVIIMQLSPIYLLLLSIWIFKESFSRIQGVGLIIVIAGQIMFFNQKLGEIFSGTDQTVGILLVLFSGLSWAGYALAQKQLLKTYPSASIVMMICIGCSFILLPVIRPASIFTCSSLQLWCVLYCVLNTVFGYSAFAESLNHLEATRVSALLTIVPLITMALMTIGHAMFPGIIEAEGLNSIGVMGAVGVVAGSSMCALVRRRA
ncbi:DMT family transporter [Elusimicrobiota bacterium]